ncbi:MAG TPA: hypothetical protein VK790_07795 [Solirubrobacteraceae bacterium]|jgi:hypothetical protein|nr:hypothetical protein [Solirubrobacteraceae bacterium]
MVAVALCMLAAALLGPAQTLAQTRKPACQTTARAKAKHASHACARPSHKAKTRRTAKHSSKHASGGTTTSGLPGTSAAVPAQCENGSVPTRAGTSFTCSDGSEPECENGADPTASRNGRSLLCPVLGEAEPTPAEAECEEEGLECTSLDSSVGEKGCEGSAGGDAGFVCEGED